MEILTNTPIKTYIYSNKLINKVTSESFITIFTQLLIKASTKHKFTRTQITIDGVCVGVVVFYIAECTKYMKMS